MNMKTPAISLLFLALAACGGKEKAADATPDVAAISAPAAAASSASKARLLPIGDGIAVPFAYTIRSQGSAGEPAVDGSVGHVLRVELEGIGANEAASSLRIALRKQGFKSLKSTTAGDVTTHVVRNNEGLRIRYVVIPKGPDLNIALSSADATGLVTFYWKAPAAK